MFAPSLITFRETLETVLVVGIILTFLYKTKQLAFIPFVWRGIIAGIGLAVILAMLLERFFGGLAGRGEQLFEGVLMFVTAGFLTWMILWVHRQKDAGKKIREKVSIHAKDGYGFGIFFLVVSSVFREGTETVLYLKASSIAGAENQLYGAALGIGSALIVGSLLFRWAIRVNLAFVFTSTSIFLLMFAAGLVAHGVHEFQEAGFLPVFAFDPVINLSHILDHKSTFGSLLRTLFGYTSKPTILEVISYGSYMCLIVLLQRITDRLLIAKHRIT